MTDDTWDRKPPEGSPADLSAFPPLPPASNSLPGQTASLPSELAPTTGHQQVQPGFMSEPTAQMPQPQAQTQPQSQTQPQAQIQPPTQAPAAPTAPPQSVSGAGWSALGATPAAPPVRPAPAPGATQYLPPVAPPAVSSGPPTLAAGGLQSVKASQAEAKTSSRWGWRALISFAAGGLVAASGFGAAQLSSNQGSETVAATTSTTIETASARESGPVSIPEMTVEEPAALVAAVLGPSVVQIETGLGVGSGVIFGDGLILTNNHVVEGALQMNVKLADGSVLPATVVGSDVNTDVAVVSVGPNQDLPIAQLALGEKPRVGQIAIAIGSPFDLQQSVTAGIVSAVDRPIPSTDRSFVAMIQTDAPINPGNSGGALADRLGRVIGINTSIQTDGLTSANVGVGFAVPIDTAIRVADLLVAGEPIKPGFLGVSGAEPVSGEAGVELTEITVGSAAAAAGLQVGDRVLSLNGAPVTGFFELAGMVVANQAGDTVSVDLIRDGEQIQIDVTLGERSPND